MMPERLPTRMQEYMKQLVANSRARLRPPGAEIAGDENRGGNPCSEAIARGW